LDHEARVVGRRLAVEDEGRVVPHCSRRAVATLELHRALPVRSGGQPHGSENGVDRPRIQAPVLRRERIDRRRDDDEAIAVDPTRRVDLAREHEGVGAFDVGPQERPRLVRLVVTRIAAHMTPPHHARAGRTEPVDHAGRLRIVQQHDVATVDKGEHLGEVGAQVPFVGAVLVRAEWTTVAPRAVQEVVQSLRDREELRAGVEYEPPVLDPRPAPIGEQCLEHLGHATAVRRRVDMPDRAVAERAPRPRRCVGQATGALGRQDAREQVER
jgi:hypothetical protein